MQHKIDIHQGPRSKSLATYHLEYIAHAMLMTPDNVTIRKINDDIIVKVKQMTFNLTAILDAQPDFEQLHFTNEQLDAYKAFRARHNFSNYFRFSHYHLHKSEKIAIAVWTGGSYETMNKFIRNKELDVYFPHQAFNIILSCCIAGSAISKPYPKPVNSAPSFRGEHNENVVITSRNDKISQHQLAINKGFTASASKIGSFYREREVKIDMIQSGKAYNPMGKYIARLSVLPNENEVLYPSDTEFYYELLKVTGYSVVYKATPVRSVNAEELGLQKTYQHNFTAEQLNEIMREHAILSPAAKMHSGHDTQGFLTILLKDLKAQKITLKHNLIRRLFDTVSNPKKQACLQKAITAIELVTNNAITAATVQTAVAAVNEALADHTKLVSATIFRSKPGRTDAALQFAADRMKAALFMQQQAELPQQKEVETVEAVAADDAVILALDPVNAVDENNAADDDAHYPGCTIC
jgi:hypothetical protein